jgi:hypothetical protein
MAIQTGPVFLQGRYGNACTYWCSGQWRLRQVSSLTGKRVKTSKAFKNTMAFAGLLKRASVIASKVYKALPAHWKQFWMYRSFVGEAMGMLKAGQQEETVFQVLWDRYAAEFVEGYEEEKGFIHEEVARIIKNKRLVVRHVAIYELSKSIWRAYTYEPKKWLPRRRRYRKRRAISGYYEELIE